MIVTDLKILRYKSTELLDEDEEWSLKHIVNRLELELNASKMKGVGLSAIQIGITIRVCIIRTDKLSLDLYNAKIISGSESIIFKGEGCLSIPEVYLDTRRMNKITVLNGDGKEYKLEGFEAVVCQHEIDHFDGILFLDRGVKDESTRI